jgi:Tol biopolymer transport system component
MKWLNCKEIKVLLVVFVFAVVLGGTANADFTFGEPTPLGPTINAGGKGAYFPSISADGLQLYFCSNRPGGISNRADIWMSSRSTIQEDWGEPVNLGPKVNSYNHDWDPSISSDGLELYFASQRPDGSYPGFDIFVTERQTVDDDWGKPVDLGAIINSPTGEIGPCLSAGGLELYFTSDRPYGGQHNIYVARRTAKDEPWQEPIPLNENVNGLPHSLWSPNISADGLVLFFDSGDGIWMTRRETPSDPWQEPVDIGPMINTWYAEAAAVSHDGSMLYFDSDRPGGTAEWNIWQAPIISICDFNGDGNIDTEDLLIMINNWSTDNSICDIGPMPWGDGVVDIEDLKVFIKYWEQENIQEDTEAVE